VVEGRYAGKSMRERGKREKGRGGRREVCMQGDVRREEVGEGR